jgi:hypothetical protein
MAEAALVEPNIAAAQRLVGLLDAAGMRPRAVVWTFTSERDSWRLWIVPPVAIADKREFYLKLAQIFGTHAADLAGLDLGEIQYVSDSHPVIRGLNSILHFDGTGDARISNNSLNGFFLPEAVVVRMNI